MLEPREGMIDLERPQGVVLRCKSAIMKFRGVVCELDMPTVDLDAAVQQIVDSVDVRDDGDHELILTAFNMSEQDGLFENAELDGGQQERIHTAVMLLGKELKKEIDFHQGYQIDGRFPYELERLINNDTLVLKRKLDTSASADHYPADESCDENIARSCFAM